MLTMVFTDFLSILRGYIQMLFALPVDEGISLGTYLVALSVVGAVLMILLRSIRSPGGLGPSLGLVRDKIEDRFGDDTEARSMAAASIQDVLTRSARRRSGGTHD